MDAGFGVEVLSDTVVGDGGAVGGGDWGVVNEETNWAWLLQNEWRVPANPGFLMAERPFEHGLNLGISR